MFVTDGLGSSYPSDVLESYLVFHVALILREKHPDLLFFYSFPRSRSF